MRILQVTPYYPPHVGGIEYHVEALSRKLVEAGHEVTVYTSNVPKTRKHEVVDGVEIYRFNCPFAPLNNPIMPGLLLKLIKSGKFDIVHTHGYLQLSSNLVAIGRIVTRRPFVITSHGAILNYRGWRGVIEAIYHRSIGKFTLRSARKVIALTTTQAEILEKLGARQRDIIVVPNWVDLYETTPDIDIEKFCRTYKLGNSQVVLFVGGLQPRKGVEYLIKAMKYCKTKPAVVIIGDEGPRYRGSRANLEKQVLDLGLKEQVMFLGSFPREELTAAYKAADLFILPSLAEGLPLVLLEAMSFGKCVIATKIPGNVDVVKDGWNGVLVEPKNPQELAQKIDWLLADSASRERLGTQARRDVEQNYSPQAVLGKILSLYQETPDNLNKSSANYSPTQN
jgi:glycosyltransferase involved in cell wall biosynthesis